MDDGKVVCRFITIERDGSVTPGALVGEIRPYRGSEGRPAICVGEEHSHVFGGYQAGVYIELSDETNNRWKRWEDVIVNTVSEWPWKPNGPRREWKVILTEEADHAPDLVSDDMAYVVVRMPILTHDELQVNGKPINDEELLAIGRLAGDPPKGPDRGRNVIIRLYAWEVLCLTAKDGGEFYYVLLDNGLLCPIVS